MTIIKKYCNFFIIAAAFCILFSDAFAQMKDDDLLKYGETQIILGKYKSASDTVLALVKKPSLQFHYLMGVCFEKQEKWQDAIDHFQKATVIDPNNERSMIALSYMGLGRAMMASGQYEQAIESFTIVTTTYYSDLDPDYPRYPNYLDNANQKIHNIADDAQFRIAECYERLGETEKARKAYAKVNRFYPFSAVLSEANDKLASLLNQ